MTPDNEASMARADDIRLAPTPDSTDEAQRSLGDGILPIRTRPAPKITIVTCPVCRGTSKTTEVNCDICHRVGELQLVEHEGGIMQYRTVDKDELVLGVPLPNAAPKPVDPNDLRKVDERLSLLLGLVRGAGTGNKLYKVSVTHRSPLDGEDEVSTIHTWAKNEQSAGYIATHDVTQRQWAKVNGRPELVRNAPVVSAEWLALVLDLPIP